MQRMVQRLAQGEKVFLALGANIGNRSVNILSAIRALSRYGQVVSTSNLYENPPAYIHDQPSFLNCACLLETSIHPQDLMRNLKSLEQEIGRTPTIRNGPRLIDIDILYYGSRVVNEPAVVIPHPRIKERDFVLQPLVDMDPNLRDMSTGSTTGEMLDALRASKNGGKIHGVSSENTALNRVTPKRRGTDDLWTWGSRTLLMGVLNVTPDSFSDGGRHFDVATAVDAAFSMLSKGVDIIDVGGESTRPGAAPITVEEEIRRVVPVIQGIRARSSEPVISIDTRNASVAEAAVDAGADMVNDVSGGAFDTHMHNTVARLGVPYILMHMRGTPETMQQLTDYQGDTVATVAHELQDCIDSAMRAGIPRWNIIVDPGLGFAKTSQQNLELIRGLPRLRSLLGDYPLLLGPSRKKFLGIITGKNIPEERDWATAAAASACIAGGADLVRVHETNNMPDVVRVSDAIWRV